MANQRVHLIPSGENVVNFLYPKSEQFPVETVNSVCSRESQSESRNIQTIQNNHTVNHVGFGSYNNCMSYISFVSGLNGYSKAIKIRQPIGPKGGRPRKLQSSKLSIPKKKKLKKRQATPDSDTNGENSPPVIEGPEAATTVVTTTCVTDALNVIDKRKKSIKAKLLLKKEHLLTREEEQDIHTRADIYAMTTLPDPEYYILPQDDPLPQPQLRLEDVHIMTSYPPARRKRRRNYGTTNCYVNYHNDEDVFDNTKMLPLGTRLLKPPTKLVELVAHAIDGSPDGLLQVQQIYTFLQNKYPFYRYMERVAINSWRSSIRHALYQKWFRKIRFDLSYINSKGCYWAINHKTSPREWNMPDSNTVPEEVDACLKDLAMDQELQTSISALLEEEKRCDPHSQSDVMAIVKEFTVSLPSEDELDDPMIDVIDLLDSTDHHVPQPVREPDPILATCGLDWSSDGGDVYLSSDDLGCSSLGSSTDSTLESPSFLPSPDDDLAASIFGNLHHSLNSKHGSKMTQSNITSDNLVLKNANLTGQKPRVCPFSPLVNWTPNWEEYGAYILSPQNTASLKCLNSGLTEDCLNEDVDSDLKDLDVDRELYDKIESLYSDCYNSDSAYSDIEIIAEFPKSEFDSPEELNYEYML